MKLHNTNVLGFIEESRRENNNKLNSDVSYTWSRKTKKDGVMSSGLEKSCFLEKKFSRLMFSGFKSF